MLRKWTGGSWDEMSKDAGDSMPGWLAAKVRQLRPVVETGYENTLLMRLCVEEALSAKRGAGVTGTRPLRRRDPRELGRRLPRLPARAVQGERRAHGGALRRDP